MLDDDHLDQDDPRRKRRLHELRDLRIREISAVDRPANRRRFLIVKRALDHADGFESTNLRKAAADVIEHFVEVTLRVQPHLTRLEAECQVYDEHPDLVLADYIGADRGEPMPVPGSRDFKATG